MTPEQFNHYAQQGYNRIPVSREVLADLDTPLSAYLKLADGPIAHRRGQIQINKNTRHRLVSDKRLKVYPNQPGLRG